MEIRYPVVYFEHVVMPLNRRYHLTLLKFMLDKPRASIVGWLSSMAFVQYVAGSHKGAKAEALALPDGIMGNHRWPYKPL
jgi:hypothetical protein